MAFLVYKVADYGNTAENEQYLAMCKILRDFYGNNKNRDCLVLGNCNVNGRELDALLVTNHAFIVVEFKNFGGNVLTASENSPWTMDGINVKGGAHQNPFAQARKNRSSVYTWLKTHFGNTAQVAVLISFNKNIGRIIDQDLSLSTKFWLKITDMRSFCEKVRSFSTKVELSSTEVFGIPEKLCLANSLLDTVYSDSTDRNCNNIASYKLQAQNILDSVGVGHLPIDVFSYVENGFDEEYRREYKVSVKGVSKNICALLLSVLLESGVRCSDWVYDETSECLSWFVGSRILHPHNTILFLSFPAKDNLKTYLLCKVVRTDDGQDNVQYQRICPTLLSLSFNELKEFENVKSFIDDNSEIFCLEGYGLEGVEQIKCDDFVDRLGSNVIIEAEDSLIVCTHAGVRILEKESLFKSIISTLLKKIDDRLLLAQHCCMYNDAGELTTWGQLYEKKYKEMLYEILNGAEGRIDNFVYPYLTLQKIVPEGEQLINPDPYGIMSSVYDLILSDIKEVAHNFPILSGCKFAGNNDIIRTILEL